MNKRIIIPLTIIVIILTLVIFSITIKSVNWDVDEISEVNSTTELARLISLHPDVFWNASVDEIFSRNTRKRSNGTYGLNGNENDDEAKYVDICYHTAACIFHDQTDSNGDKYAHKITNIIEIESPGIMKVYKYTGDRGNLAYESATLDLTTDESARAIFNQMKSKGIIDSSETYNYDNMKKDISAFAYLIYDTTLNAKNANPVASESYKYTETKNAIHWFWKQPGGTIAIRKYAKITGKLDNYYYNAQKQNSQVTSTAVSKRQEALKEAASVIQPATLQKLEASSPTLEISYVGDKAYIGPLKVKYTGGTPTIKINISETTENWITASGWVTRNSDDTFNTIQTGAITSEQEFYAVTEKSKVENLSKINVKVELKYTQYSAKLALTTCKTNDGQNLMFYMGKKEDKIIPVDWSGEITKEIKIEKQDENGNPLSQSGIRFEVRDEAGTLVGTLTTRNDGKTNSIGVKPNSVYTIRETLNETYGYKNASITDATITGGTILERTEQQIRIQVAEADATIIVKNSPELGNLTIEKIDENGNPMQGVEFVIWQTYKGYLSIDGQSTHQTTSKGTDMKALYESDQIVYPAGDTTEQKLAQATRYITNEEGKIVLNNLEIYRAKGEKYEYIIREMSNGNYGYKGMVMTNDDITITEGELVNDMYSGDDVEDGGKDSLRKKAQFIIGNNTTVKVANTQKLGNLVVHKKDNDKNLENVEFTLYKAVSENTGYIRLIKDSEFVQVVNTEIDITEYEVEYVEVDRVDEATIFKTNEEGKIIINNLEVYSGIDENYNPVKYDYWLTEQSNNEYGYKHMTMTVEGVTSEEGTIIETDPDSREVQFTLSEEKTSVLVEIDNPLEVASLEIKKVNQDNESIENVEFVIEKGDGDYILLKDVNGKALKKVTGTATINIDENFEIDEYSIEYVKSKEVATKFVTEAQNETDQDAKIVINNLEVYASKEEKYSYTAHEVANDNYGYGSVENRNLSKTIELKLDESNILQLENTRHLGKLSIIKHDKNDERIVLPNVSFAIEQTSQSNNQVIGQYAYLALYDNEGKLQTSITGTATVNKNNKAQITDSGKEYEVRYYYSELPYNELTDEQKAQITKFVTDELGNLSIDNLEVYSQLLRDADTKKDPDANKYTYTLIEISNANYGFEIPEEIDLRIKLDPKAETTKKVANEQTKIKISGYVWVENPNEKSTKYDLLYTESNADIKLTDLYMKNEDGKLQQNLNAKIPVKILLRNTITGETREPDEFIYQEKDEEVQDAGKYTFIDVEIEKLADYEIVFEYNGFYYTTIIPNLGKENGSKVKEVEADRKALNEKFGEVKYDREIISTDGNTINTLEYEKEGRESYVTEFGFETTVQANTTETSMNLKSIYDGMVKTICEALKNSEEIEIKMPEVIDNINMGIMLRNQPTLAIGSDINSVLVMENESEFIYEYNSRQYEKILNDSVGVGFEDAFKQKKEEETTVDRYLAEVYASGVNSLKNEVAEMNVSIIYRIQINNCTDRFTSVVHEIENFYDADYTIKEIGFSIDSETKQIGNKIYDSESELPNEITITRNTDVEVKYGEDVEEGEKRNYNSSIISLGQNGVTLEKFGKQNIYIKFEVSQDAIKDLLNGVSTYHNATEIVSYSTYYNEVTTKEDVEEQANKIDAVTEQGKPGEIYAGIITGAEVGNIELNLVKEWRNEASEISTPVLVDTHFEIDETSAPSLILQAEGTRIISGTVWEDTQTEASKNTNERLGDGIYDESTEKPIQNVTVSLHKLNDDGSIQASPAKYSDNTPAITETNSEGKYTLGNPETEVGIIPDKYVIVYTYGQGTEKQGEASVIVGKEDEEDILIDALEYKSTVVKSNVMRESFEKQEEAKQNEEAVEVGTYKWFINEESNVRYSNARDNITLRKEYASMPIDADDITSDIYDHLREAVLNLNTLSNYDISTMSAYTPGIEVGIHFTENNKAQVTNRDEAGNITYTDLKEELTNVDFGIIERPRVIMDIDLKITELEVIAQNGASIIPKGNPSDLTTRMQSVKQIVEDDELVETSVVVDKALLQGATMNLEYTATVANNSETDYFEVEYYYYGEKDEEMKSSPRPKRVVSYLPETLTFDESKNIGDIWTKIDLDTLEDQGMITTDVAEALEEKSCDIFITNAFENLEQEEVGQEKMYVSKVLSITDATKEILGVEIIELTGIRPIKNTTPGNYMLGGSLDEIDDDEEPISVITPTGLTVNYTVYIIAAIATLAIVGIGILIIKKKVIK